MGAAKRRSRAIITGSPAAETPGAGVIAAAPAPETLELEGRRVGWALYGERHARGGVVYLHGFPGSCLEPLVVAEALRSAGLALLAFDRPGYGASATRAGDARDPGLAARIAGALVDRLGWQRYALLAVSGSGPAAVAALARPDPRLAGALLLAVFPPLFRGRPRADSDLLRVHAALRRRCPPLLGLESRLVARHFGHRPARLRRRLLRLLPPPDRVSLGSVPLAAVLEASWARALVGGGGRGLLVDLAHFFDPLDPPPPPPFPCLSVHGGRDRVVPPALQDYLCEALPYLGVRRWPQAGHFSWVETHAREILETLKDWLAG